MMLSSNQPRSLALSKLKKTAVIIFVLSVVSAVALSIINGMCMGENYLYENGAPTIILPILALIAVILALIGARFVKNEDYSICEVPGIKTPATLILSLLFVSLFLAIFILYVMFGAFDIGYGKSIVGNKDLLEELGTLTLFYQIMIALTPLAPVYFVISAFNRKTSAFFGSVTLLWTLAYILRLYFDITDWVMSPRKLSMICAMCFAAMFFLYEIRFSFARGNIRRYFFVSALTTVFCFSSGMAGIISSLSGVYPSSFEIPYYAVALAIGLYSGIRLYFVAFAGCEAEEIEEVEEAEVTEGAEKE